MFWHKLKKAGKQLWAGSWQLVLNAVVVLAIALIASPAIAAPSPVSQQCLAQLMTAQPEAAIQACTAALAANANDSQAYFFRGLAQYRLQQYEAAIADFDQHLLQHPEDARAYYNRGLAQFAQGHVSAAIADYHQALTFSQVLATVEMSDLYNDLGVAYLSHQKSTEALFALNQAVKLATDDARAYFNRGCVCHHRGELTAALADFEQALALTPDSAEAYLNRGLVHRELGHVAAARADFHAAANLFEQQENLTALQKVRLLQQQTSAPATMVG